MEIECEEPKCYECVCLYACIGQRINVKKCPCGTCDEFDRCFLYPCDEWKEFIDPYLGQ